VFFLSVTGVWAQDEAPPVFRATGEPVLADVQILNVKTGLPAPVLKAGDLRIYEDDEHQEIVQFSRDELPLSAVLLFDLTESVRGLLKSLAAGAKEALGHFKQGDKENSFGVYFIFRSMEQGRDPGYEACRRRSSRHRKRRPLRGSFLYEFFQA
jgi:hypothetical protein